MTNPDIPPRALAEAVVTPEAVAGLEPVRSVRTPIRLV